MIEIRRFFETKIAVYAKSKSLGIAPENGQFKPGAGDYLSIDLIPARPFDATLCGKARSGIFQVKFNGAAGVYTATADAVCAEIMALYEGKHGSFYIDNPYRTGGFVVDGRYVVVVSIPYVVY